MKWNSYVKTKAHTMSFQASGQDDMILGMVFSWVIILSAVFTMESGGLVERISEK